MEALAEGELTRLQRGFGYTREELKMVIAPMALEGKEAMWSMGDDTPDCAAGARAASALWLLPAAIRAGHESGDRFLA